MIGREFKADTVGRYRYGMNTQEKDDEIYGDGNAMSAQFWEYDSRLGRRWNIDPVFVASISPFASFENSPILYNDPDGKFRIRTNSTDKEFRREERRNLRFIIRQTYKEALSWNKQQWQEAKKASGYNTKLGYLKIFIPGLGPAVRFSDDAKDSPGEGDGNGGSTRSNGMRSSYAETRKYFNKNGKATTSLIVLDKGINRLLNDVRESSNSGKLRGMLVGANSSLTGDKNQFISDQRIGSRNFVVTVLGHEIAHHGSHVNGVSEAPPLTRENGNMHEIGVYGGVRGHLDFGYAVFSSMEYRLFTPILGLNNYTSTNPVLANRRDAFGSPVKLALGF